MKFKALSNDDKRTLTQMYSQEYNRGEMISQLADRFGVHVRTIRKWAKRLGLKSKDNTFINSKILIYDIETCRVPAMVWYTGKQYIRHEQLREEPRIISISWKWLGDNKVHSGVWDKNQNDEELLRTFVKEYNKATMVLGQNNKNFDNRWINARAAKFNIDVNIYVRSFDIMRQSKTKFRLPSYSLAFMCKYFGVPQKLEHEGIVMWDKIQEGTPEERKEYLAKMVDYNKGDIISTEALYYRLRGYFNHQTHIGVMNGGERFTCPDTGSYDVELLSTTWTPAGTMQRIMISNKTNTKYKITNKQYMKYIDWKIKNCNL